MQVSERYYLQTPDSLYEAASGSDRNGGAADGAAARPRTESQSPEMPTGDTEENPALAAFAVLSGVFRTRPTGFEPATTGSTVRYSSQLSYGPKKVLNIGSIPLGWKPLAPSHRYRGNQGVDNVDTYPKRLATSRSGHRPSLPPVEPGGSGSARRPIPRSGKARPTPQTRSDQAGLACRLPLRLHRPREAAPSGRR